MNSLWCIRTHDGADKHHCTSGGEIRKLEREHAKRTAIFAQFLILDNFSNDGNIHFVINIITAQMIIGEISYIHFVHNDVSSSIYSAPVKLEV